MALLVHEIWEDVSRGRVLHTCCFAGPLGDGCRQTLEPGARLLTTFEAGSHFEAMTFYNNYLGREKYSTNQPSDYLPYSDDWLAEQQPER